MRHMWLLQSSPFYVLHLMFYCEIVDLYLANWKQFFETKYFHITSHLVADNKHNMNKGDKARIPKEVDLFFFLLYTVLPQLL